MTTRTAAVVGGPPRAAVVLEPAATRPHGCWSVCEWPEPDLPLGTLVALKVELRSESGQRFLANGWQSWAAPTVRTLGHAESPPPPPGHSRRHLFRLVGTGDSSYDFLATSDAVGGFTEGGGLLVADTDEGVVYAARRHVAGRHPPVLVATGDGAALLDDLLGMANGRSPETQPVSWSTWMAYGERIDSSILARASAEVRELAADGLCDALLVDDGWQRSIGDWTPDPMRFPADLQELCVGIRAAGVRAGIWTAPVLAAPRSEVVHRHPEWMARHPDGRPVVGADVDHWGGPVWVLDVTRSAVREHLAAVAAAHAAVGFRTFKLDFLYAAVDAAEAAVACGRGGDPARGDVVAPDAVVAAVLDAIRAGAGEDVLMLGCCAPLWPSIGHVD